MAGWMIGVAVAVTMADYDYAYIAMNHLRLVCSFMRLLYYMMHYKAIENEKNILRSVESLYRAKRGLG